MQWTCILLKEIVTFEKIENELAARFGVGSVFLPILTKPPTAKMLSEDLSGKVTLCKFIFPSPYDNT